MEVAARSLPSSGLGRATNGAGDHSCAQRRAYNLAGQTRRPRPGIPCVDIPRIWSGVWTGVRIEGGNGPDQVGGLLDRVAKPIVRARMFRQSRTVDHAMPHHSPSADRRLDCLHYQISACLPVCTRSHTWLIFEALKSPPFCRHRADPQPPTLNRHHSTFGHITPPASPPLPRAFTTTPRPPRPA